jgi:hypothetical protein
MRYGSLALAALVVAALPVAALAQDDAARISGISR